jgi:hypothetical protein
MRKGRKKKDRRRPVWGFKNRKWGRKIARLVLTSSNKGIDLYYKNVRTQ